MNQNDWFGTLFTSIDRNLFHNPFWVFTKLQGFIQAHKKNKSELELKSFLDQLVLGS